jgi:hypothetical protein
MLSVQVYQRYRTYAVSTERKATATVSLPRVYEMLVQPSYLTHLQDVATASDCAFQTAPPLAFVALANCTVNVLQY